jgi:uncharacterized protein (TIGR03086 family)
MTTENLERAFAAARTVIANVKPDQLSDPTPCATWQVRDIINHVIGNSYYTAAVVDAGEHVDLGETDYTTGDMIAAYDEGIRRALAAFNTPGALDKTLKLHFGPLPATAWMGIATTDAFTHAWDISKATGQPTDLDPEFAEQLLAGARQFIQPAFRGADRERPFGAEAEPPANATPADRLAAFLGRTV